MRPPSSAPPPDGPFVGPRPLQIGEPLFGREHEVRDLSDLLAVERIVLLHSPSGAGKTSLVQAGLVPLLQQENFVICGPLRVNLARTDEERKAGANGLVLSVLRGLKKGLCGGHADPTELPPGLTLPEFFEDYDNRHGKTPTFLFFDQFEEVLTAERHNRRGKKAFFDQLGDILRAPHRHAVFAMREEFVAALDPYLARIPRGLSTRFRLDFLKPEAAMRAVMEPARLFGVTIQEPAAKKLIDDLRQKASRPASRPRPAEDPSEEDSTLPPALDEDSGRPVEPVLLQVVCLGLWEAIQARNLRQVGVVDINRLAEPTNALARYYAAKVKQVADKSGIHEWVVRRWMERRLIDENGRRDLVVEDSAEYQELGQQVIRGLIGAYLVREDASLEKVLYELAHDRLIEPIRRDNAPWRQKNLSVLQLSADVWQAKGRPRDQLVLRGDELVAAERWAEDHPEQLTELERAYLAECQEHRRKGEMRRQMDAARVQKWWFIVGLIAAGVVIPVLLGLTIWAVVSERKATDATKSALIEKNSAIDAKKQAEAAEERAKARLGILDFRRSLSVAFYGLQSDPELSICTVLNGFDELEKKLGGVGREVRDEAELAKRQGEVVLNLAVQGSRVRRTLRPETSAGDVEAVAYSNDGKRIATAHQDSVAIVWDAGSGERLATLQHEKEEVVSVAFHPHNPNKLATAGGPGFYLWESGPKPAGLRTPLKKDCNAVAFSPDGKRLATACDDRFARVWDVTGKEPREILSFEHEDKVVSVAFSPDGKSLATAAGRLALVWDASLPERDPPPKPQATLKGHFGNVGNVTFSPKEGQRLATASEDGTARIWDRCGKTLMILFVTRERVNAVAFGGPDGQRLATAGRDRLVKVWDVRATATRAKQGGAAPPLEARVPWLTLAGHRLIVTGVAFSPDGKYLASSSDDGNAKVWDAGLGEEWFAPDLATPRTVLAVAASPDQQLFASATVSVDEKGDAVPHLALWDVATGKAKLWPRSPAYCSALAFSTDSRFLATGDEAGSVSVWDCTRESVKLEHTFPRAGAGKNPQQTNVQVRSVIFSDDGKRLAAGTQDGFVRVWDVSSGEQVFSVKSPSNPDNPEIIFSVTFDSTGQRVAAACNDRFAYIWDIAAGGKRVHFETAQHGGSVYAVAFSPDGKFLATGSGYGKARVWEITEGKAEKPFAETERHGDGVRCVAFNKDNPRRLITGSYDRMVRIWDLTPSTREIRELYRIVGPTATICDAFWTPGSERVAVVSYDNSVRFYELD